ncbi:MAG: hypothetical protein E7442_02015 [Ruminococcaceae bacterium]|nr:hypothetical protein [Oscillospiraceae bacterium]
MKEEAEPIRILMTSAGAAGAASAAGASAAGAAGAAGAAAGASSFLAPQPLRRARSITQTRAREINFFMLFSSYFFFWFCAWFAGWFMEIAFY